MEGGTDRVTIETLQRLVDAFNAHDVDAVMGFFTDDPVLELPRGPDPWGRRFQGRAQVRAGLASRFAGIPDVHYGDDRHWVSGDRGCSEWLLTGTTHRGSGSRCAAATCSSSRATRSPGRTPTGSSSSGDALPGRRPLNSPVKRCQKSSREKSGESRNSVSETMSCSSGCSSVGC